MKTYIVTGCAGMIGWRVTELLISNGANVLGIDDLNQAYDNRIKIWRSVRFNLDARSDRLVV